MADENEQTEQAETASTGKKAAPSDSKLAPILGLLAALIVGVVFGFMVKGMIMPEQIKEDGGGTEVVGSQTVGGSDSVRLEDTAELDFPTIIANLRGEEIGRYVKVSVRIWLSLEDMQSITAHEDRIKAVLQEQMVQVLRSYDKTEISDERALTKIKTQFQINMDRELRRLYSKGPEVTYVKKIVMSDLMLQ